MSTSNGGLLALILDDATMEPATVQCAVLSRAMRWQTHLTLGMIRPLRCSWIASSCAVSTSDGELLALILDATVVEPVFLPDNTVSEPPPGIAEMVT